MCSGIIAHANGDSHQSEVLPVSAATYYREKKYFWILRNLLSEIRHRTLFFFLISCWPLKGEMKWEGCFVPLLWPKIDRNGQSVTLPFKSKCWKRHSSSFLFSINNYSKRSIILYKWIHVYECALYHLIYLIYTKTPF